MADNLAGDLGGGIYGEGGGSKINITNSTIIHNHVVPADVIAGAGGGIANSDGTVSITNSTITGNSAEGSGGGIDGGSISITNSTISGNSAVGLGGGIIGRSMKITSCTITGNTVQGSGGGIDTSGDSVCFPPGLCFPTSTVKSSIVAEYSTPAAGRSRRCSTGRFNLTATATGVPDCSSH